MLRLSILSAALALTACATPAQLCRSDATRALAKLDRMIAETEATLARGYRLIPIPGSSRDFLDCVVEDDEPVGLCMAEADRPDLLRQEINIPAEQARLASLRQQRAAEAQRAAAALAACPQE